MLSGCNKQPWQLTGGNAGECNTLIINSKCGSQKNAFAGWGEQFSCTQTKKNWVFWFLSLSQPLKGHLIGALVLFSIERLSSQAFSHSKFDWKMKKYLERRFLTNANPYFRIYFPFWELKVSHVDTPSTPSLLPGTTAIAYMSSAWSVLSAVPSLTLALSFQINHCLTGGWIWVNRSRKSSSELWEGREKPAIHYHRCKETGKQETFQMGTIEIFSEAYLGKI